MQSKLDVNAIAVNDEPLMDLISRPKDVLLQIKDALQSRDYVLLADILQYEFHEVTEQWQAVIGRLHELAEDSAKTPQS